MTVLKSLIIGWSIVWGLLLVAISNISVKGISVFLISQGLNATKAIILATLYGFVVWAIGCAIICLAIFLIKKALPQKSQQAPEPSEPELRDIEF
jgi:beta-lactamase regulating signal transducer with metallopeptidase domain